MCFFGGGFPSRLNVWPVFRGRVCNTGMRASLQYRDAMQNAYVPVASLGSATLGSAMQEVHPKQSMEHRILPCSRNGLPVSRLGVRVSRFGSWVSRFSFQVRHFVFGVRVLPFGIRASSGFGFRFPRLRVSGFRWRFQVAGIEPGLLRFYANTLKPLGH